MANFNKKWGTVIACWAVALVMIITGVCLGLTIPSSAAGDPVAVVTCGDTVEYFTDITAVQDYVGKLTTSKESPAVIKLLKDIHTDKTVNVGAIYESGDMQAHYVVFDLAGHILQSDDQIVLGCALGGSFTVMDSNPTVTRYVTREGEVGNYTYTFSDEKLLGVFADEIKGGVVTGKEVVLNAFQRWNKLTINGGNYLGTGFINMVGQEISESEREETEATYGFVPAQSVVINAGVLQLYGHSAVENDYGLTGNYGIVALSGSSLEINGGCIFGKVAYGNSETEKFEDVNLNNPQFDAIKVNSNIKLQETTDANGVKVYTAVDATTGEPIVPEEPDVPTVTEQPTNNNNSLIALIVLGAAAAVMVVGVTVIIIVNAKRRKKVA